MKKIVIILGSLLLTSTVFASKLVVLQRAPLKQGEVYKFCDIAIFNEDKISKKQVVQDLFMSFSPVFTAKLEAGGELNRTESIEEQVLSLPSSSETAYTIKVKNDSSAGKLEIVVLKNNEILLSDSSDSSIGDQNEQLLSDGTRYFRGCGTNIGQ